MSRLDFQKTDRQELARLLKLDADTPGWQTRDLAGILKHQLEAPLEVDLGEAFPEHRRTILKCLAAQAPAVRTFGDLLQQAQPSQELLELVKQFAKRHRAMENGPLPPKVATVLYYAVIAAAFVRTHGVISSLDTSTQVDGIRWAMHESWVDPMTRSLLQEGLHGMMPGMREI